MTTYDRYKKAKREAEQAGEILGLAARTHNSAVRYHGVAMRELEAAKAALLAETEEDFALLEEDL